MSVAAHELREFVACLLVEAGAGADAAAQTAASLIEADARGHGSHGVRLVPGYAERLRDGRLDADGAPEIVRDDGSTLVIDANALLGQVVVPWLAELAAERARKEGIVAVTVRRCGHLGRLFDLADAIATRGRIGIVMANDGGQNAVVAPYGGAEPRLATNPIAIGIPRREPPHLVLDMATSVTSHGGLQLSRAAGLPDVPGSASGDVLLPAAGPKGFGLALVVEILAGALAGAGHAGNPADVDQQGILLLVIDVERFLSAAAFAEHVEEVVAEVKRGNPGVLVPGEAGAIAAASAAGRVRIPTATWARLAALAEEHGIEIPSVEEEQ